ncbi:NAD(P)-binding domain-containing protein [Streptomyces sp. NPDC086077]|uniref:NAD(P)-binding domain-containing protein n=1 Tax=Streptomyces sp. NPDC086077 TaxID=3154862 RepID=UPI00342C53E7
MRIGLIGAGAIAQASATAVLRGGHEVVFSNSRGPDSLSSLASSCSLSLGGPSSRRSPGWNHGTTGSSSTRTTLCWLLTSSPRTYTAGHISTAAGASSSSLVTHRKPGRP